MQEVNLKVV